MSTIYIFVCIYIYIYMFEYEYNTYICMYILYLKALVLFEAVQLEDMNVCVCVQCVYL